MEEWWNGLDKRLVVATSAADTDSRRVGVYSIPSLSTLKPYICDPNTLARFGIERLVLCNDALCIYDMVGKRPLRTSEASALVAGWPELVERVRAVLCDVSRVSLVPVAYPLEMATLSSNNKFVQYIHAVSAMNVPMTNDHEQWMIDGDERMAIEFIQSQTVRQ